MHLAQQPVRSLKQLWMFMRSVKQCQIVLNSVKFRFDYLPMVENNHLDMTDCATSVYEIVNTISGMDVRYRLETFKKSRLKFFYSNAYK